MKRAWLDYLPGDGVIQSRLHLVVSLVVHLLGLCWARFASVIQLVLVTGCGVV